MHGSRTTGTISRGWDTKKAAAFPGPMPHGPAAGTMGQPGKRVAWAPELLEQVCELLERVAPGGRFQWQNQQVVHFLIPSRDEPWITLDTKRPDALDLTLNGPKNAIGFGRVTELAWDRQLDDTREDRDQIKLRFRKPADLEKGDLVTFLQEVGNGGGRKWGRVSFSCGKRVEWV